MVRKYTILHGIFEEKYIIDILKKEIVKTRDGSNTLFVPEFDETYHSTHGAIQESLHVFIRSGLKFKTELNDISVLEVGFGTGLNALLSFVDSEDTNRNIHSFEEFPNCLKLDYEDISEGWIDINEGEDPQETIKKIEIELEKLKKE